MRSDLVVAGLTAALALACLIGAVTIHHVSMGDPLGPRAFPIMIGVCLLIVSGLLVWETLKVESSPTIGEVVMPLLRDRNVVGTLLVMLVFAIVFERLGYLLSVSCLMLVLTNMIHGRQHYVANTVVSIGFAVVSYVLFDKFLGAALPSGLLGI